MVSSEPVVQRAEALPAIVSRAAFIIPGALGAVVVDPCVVDQHIDGHAGEFRGQLLRLIRAGHIQTLDPHPGIPCRKFGERLRWFGAAMRGDDAPALGRVLFGEFQSDPGIGTRDYTVSARAATGASSEQTQQQRDGPSSVQVSTPAQVITGLRCGITYFTISDRSIESPKTL